MKSYSDELWESTFTSQEWGKYPSESLIRFVAHNFYKVPDRSVIRILEVGCGPGANLWFLTREGFEAHGVDGSKSAVMKAKNRLDSECPGWTGEVKVGDVLKLDYPDNNFDAVIDVEAVYCNDYKKSQEIYKEMARVVKPNGRLYSRTFAENCAGYGTGEKVGHEAWIVSEGPLLGHGYTRFTKYDEIDELCVDFKINSVDYLHESSSDGGYEMREWVIVGIKKGL